MGGVGVAGLLPGQIITRQSNGGVLLDKIEEPDARHWYVRATADGGWSRNVLLNQIKARAHARAGAAPSNFELTLPGEDSELAGQIAKDP